MLRGTPLWEDVSSLTRKLEQRMSPEERAEQDADARNDRVSGRQRL